MKTIATMTAGLLTAVLLSAPAHAEDFPPPPAPVYDCAQAATIAEAHRVSHAQAVAWQERALLTYGKLLAKQAKIQRMNDTIDQMRARIRRMEDRLAQQGSGR